ncbi:MAG: hypothetical protein INR65_10470 [Gluconacetobacter diazotrophicus]|nr:hypothetical protein [Gluconacetobacter diazotrophicus]
MLLALAGPATAQLASPAAQTTPAATPPSAPVPAAILPNTHRLTRDLKADTDNIKSQGNFGAQLWLVADPQFFQNWRKPDSPSLDPVEAAVRGQPLYTVIVFYGPARDAKSQASVTYDLVVRRPDGSVYAENKDLVGCQSPAPADERMLCLGRDHLNITLAPDDPAGKYTIEATVRDNVGKAAVTLKQAFTAP